MFTCCFANYISERMIFEGALYLVMSAFVKDSSSQHNRDLTHTLTEKKHVFIYFFSGHVSAKLPPCLMLPSQANKQRRP